MRSCRFLSEASVHRMNPKKRPKDTCSCTSFSSSRRPIHWLFAQIRNALRRGASGARRGSYVSMAICVDSTAFADRRCPLIRAFGSFQACVGRSSKKEVTSHFPKAKTSLHFLRNPVGAAIIRRKSRFTFPQDRIFDVST